MPPIPADVTKNPLIVVTNPEEDCSPQAVQAFLDELFDGPEPEIESLDAAEAIRAERTNARPRA